MLTIAPTSHLDGGEMGRGNVFAGLKYGGYSIPAVSGAI